MTKEHHDQLCHEFGNFYLVCVGLCSKRSRPSWAALARDTGLTVDETAVRLGALKKRVWELMGEE